ncbi:hypothetical protein NONO_c28710 [Nocardia nova SH22a]|uniref:Roadblock/LAMTOR2 domain-containing protein n=1 Tax=Nocardia nova SH22a TaxID=1415166 RepID=W5TK90_9NOCA|nr:roadblock/LC7 domain-containing protein [Nocardia nova]AHH17661.1 hypothetical protein NONO_c28710 [Nocardia nova SH22a]
MNDHPTTSSSPAGLDWILDKLVSRVSGAEGAVVLSADGLPMAGSRGLGRDNVEHLAAIASALHSLARGVGTHFGKGELHQTVIELESGFLVVTEAGNGACLALLADIESDLGLIAYEMNVVIGQVREHLSAIPRVSETVTSPYQQ